MIRRTSMISIRFSNEFLDELEKEIEKKEFKNVSDAIKTCSKYGLELYRYQKMMKDPKQANEFAKKMQELLIKEQQFDWCEKLSETQIDGFMMMLRMEKDTRYKQMRFV